MDKIRKKSLGHLMLPQGIISTFDILKTSRGIILDDIKRDWHIWIERVIVLAILIFQLLAMSLAVVPVLAHRIIFLSLVLFLVFFKPAQSKWEKISNSFSVPMLFLLIVYTLINGDRIATRIAFIDKLTKMDLFLGIVLILVLLEATRRIAGMNLTIIVSIFIVYGFGALDSGLLAHRGFSVSSFIDTQVFRLEVFLVYRLVLLSLMFSIL